MLCYENLLLSALSTLVNLGFLAGSLWIGKQLGFPLLFTGTQTLLSTSAAFAIVLLLSASVSARLIRAEPAAALSAS